MKVKFFSELNQHEAELFQASELNRDIQACYRFLPNSIAYNHEYFGPGYDDYSMVLFDDGKPIIACFAFCKDSRFLFFEEPVRFFHYGERSSLYGAYKILIPEIRKIFTRLKIRAFEVCEGEFVLGGFYHELKSSSVSHMAEVDLRRPFEDIKADIRRSLKPQVNWGEKNLRLKILHAGEHTNREFLDYKQFHIEVSGRQTRNDRTWKLQYEMLTNGQAYLVLGYLQDRLVGGSMVLHGRKTATYGVGVYDRALMAEKKPLGAFLIMQAIKWAKCINLERFEIGNVNFRDGDEKGNSIAQFKKGFTPYLTSSLKHKIVFSDMA